MCPLYKRRKRDACHAQEHTSLPFPFPMPSHSHRLRITLSSRRETTVLLTSSCQRSRRFRWAHTVGPTGTQRSDDACNRGPENDIRCPPQSTAGPRAVEASSTLRTAPAAEPQLLRSSIAPSIQISACATNFSLAKRKDFSFPFSICPHFHRFVVHQYCRPSKVQQQ